MAQASARHILVKSEAECEDLKRQIESGEDFAELASRHSQCPSGRDGGDLGTQHHAHHQDLSGEAAPRYGHQSVGRLMRQGEGKEDLL